MTCILQVSAHERMELCGKLIPKDCHPAIKQQIFKCVLNDMMNENKVCAFISMVAK